MAGKMLFIASLVFFFQADREGGGGSDTKFVVKNRKKNDFLKPQFEREQPNFPRILFAYALFYKGSVRFF